MGLYIQGIDRGVHIRLIGSAHNAKTQLHDMKANHINDETNIFLIINYQLPNIIYTQANILILYLKSRMINYRTFNSLVLLT